MVGLNHNLMMARHIPPIELCRRTCKMSTRRLIADYIPPASALGTRLLIPERVSMTSLSPLIPTLLPEAYNQLDNHSIQLGTTQSVNQTNIGDYYVPGHRVVS